MEFTHHPPAANLAAPEDGRTPDFVGSLASSRRAGLGRDRPGTGGRLLDGKPEGPGGRMWGRAVPTPIPRRGPVPGRSPPVRGSWMEFTHHPPAANLAAPEDGRTPDFVGSLASSRRAGLRPSLTLRRDGTARQVRLRSVSTRQVPSSFFYGTTSSAVAGALAQQAKVQRKEGRDWKFEISGFQRGENGGGWRRMGGRQRVWQLPGRRGILRA